VGSVMDALRVAAFGSFDAATFLGVPGPRLSSGLAADSSTSATSCFIAATFLDVVLRFFAGGIIVSSMVAPALAKRYSRYSLRSAASAAFSIAACSVDAPVVVVLSEVGTLVEALRFVILYVFESGLHL